MGRSPCCTNKEGMNRGAWTSAEDKILSDYIKLHGEGKWRNIPTEAGLKRCGKSCRLRWMNYLRPDIKRGNISPDEEDLIIRLHKLLGNRWSLIAGRLPGRTDNEIKNYWNTNLSKREKQGKVDRPPKSNQSKVNNKPIDENPTSSVIRTKASRCNKEVFITIGNGARNVAMPPASMNAANLVHNISSNSSVQAAESEDSSGNGSLITTMSPSKEENSLNFMGVFASDDQFTMLEIGTSDMDDYVMQGDAFLLPEQMEQKWRASDHNMQADYYNYDLDSDFGSMVAFLESAEEWLI